GGQEPRRTQYRRVSAPGRSTWRAETPTVQRVLGPQGFTKPGNAPCSALRRAQEADERTSLKPTRVALRVQSHRGGEPALRRFHVCHITSTASTAPKAPVTPIESTIA